MLGLKSRACKGCNGFSLERLIRVLSFIAERRVSARGKLRKDAAYVLGICLIPFAIDRTGRGYAKTRHDQPVIASNRVLSNKVQKFGGITGFDYGCADN